MSSDPKTIEQIEREIAYYARQIQHTTSADRIARAHKAIQLREQQLTDAKRVQVGTAKAGRAPEPVNNALQRVGGRKPR